MKFQFITIIALLSAGCNDKARSPYYIKNASLNSREPISTAMRYIKDNNPAYFNAIGDGNFDAIEIHIKDNNCVLIKPRRPILSERHDNLFCWGIRNGKFKVM